MQQKEQARKEKKAPGEANPPRAKKGSNAQQHTNGAGGEQGAIRTQAATLTAAARALQANHHWVPLRLEGKSPECMGKGWRKRTLGDPLPEFRDGDNLGILLGAASSGLVRLDPDWSPIPE